MKYVYLYLTCDNKDEAKTIANSLLQNRLIACAKFIDIDCMYWWEGEIVDGIEVLVIMESRSDLFDKIEQEVTKLHSYETFVLESVPVDDISSHAAKWLSSELKS